MNECYPTLSGLLYTAEEGIRLSKIFCYPLIIKPSLTLNDYSVFIAHDAVELSNYLKSDLCRLKHFFPLILECFLTNRDEL